MPISSSTLLREAGWDAHGPETTTIFGTQSYSGVTLFAPGGGGAQSLNALIGAFTRFNVPYRSGIPPREGVPDPPPSRCSSAASHDGMLQCRQKSGLAFPLPRC